MMELYFESAGTILTLITMGKTMEARAKGKTSDAITKLMDLAPKTATVERNGVESVIPVEEVQLGDVLIVSGADLMDGTPVITGTAIDGKGAKSTFTAIPYYAFGNRGNGGYRVWLPTR